MFSGNCFLNKEGVPTICHHQVGQGNAMVVALDDELNTWKKLDSNPITPKTAEGDPHHGKYRSWDPFGWLEGDTYYAIFGGKRAAIARSKSLEGPWEYVGDLMAGTVPGVAADEDISCADLFKFGDKYMLLCISHGLGCRYYLGDWKNEQFHPTFHEKMSWVDNSFFAPRSLLDDKGRRIMWAWCLDKPGIKMRTDRGWSGTMSLPRVLAPAADGSVTINPPDELERLRYAPRHRDAFDVAADSRVTIDEAAGTSLEIVATFAPPEKGRCGLVVCRSPRGEEETLVFYDADTKQLKIDTTKSSLKDEPKAVEAGPLALPAGEPLRLRVFVDKSIVEVFANGRQAAMRRIYPSLPDATGVQVFSTEGPARVTSFDAWDMMPSNPY